MRKARCQYPWLMCEKPDANTPELCVDSWWEHLAGTWRPLPQPFPVLLSVPTLLPVHFSPFCWASQHYAPPFYQLIFSLSAEHPNTVPLRSGHCSLFSNVIIVLSQSPSSSYPPFPPGFWASLFQYNPTQIFSVHAAPRKARNRGVNASLQC
jgi:hypothetical protein